MHKYCVGDIVCLKLPESLWAKSHFGNRIYGFVLSTRQDGYILIRWFKFTNPDIYWYNPNTEGLNKAL